ncbi:MAG: hypothetical protein CBB71_07785 [Rhodopirellula sp. TMED11]|nr:MAG: hypothetical protein CBB71_07785 [Rhodopirellula sp. TMED11]
MSARDSDSELQRLLTELFDGALDNDSATRLQQRLSTDADARGLYLDYCEMHAALAWEHGQVIVDIEPVAVPPERWRLRATMIWLAAMAASLLLIGAASWWLDDTHAVPSGPAIASIEQRIDAKIVAGGQEWNRDALCKGSYDLRQGLLQVKYNTGVTVCIEAPAQFEAISADRLVLHSGRVSANVPPEGIGFTVETPEAEVVDFGTDFSVEAGTGESEVHVFDGHVQVQPKALPDQPTETVDLRTDQAVRIADATHQAFGIDLAKDRFIRSFVEPKVQYVEAVRALNPTAYYRMPIRQRGLLCSPADYSGQVLIGEGQRPACAPGFVGSSLRVGGRSIGRGALVENTPEIGSEFTLMAWVYADGRPNNAILATNVTKKRGCFEWTLDDKTGRLKIRVDDQNGDAVECFDTEPIKLQTWQHYAATCDGKTLKLFRAGRMIDSKPCVPISKQASQPLYFGTNWRGKHLWEGRIDEFAIFDYAVSEEQMNELL